MTNRLITITKMKRQLNQSNMHANTLRMRMYSSQSSMQNKKALVLGLVTRDGDEKRFHVFIEPKDNMKMLGGELRIFTKCNHLLMFDLCGNIDIIAILRPWWKWW